MNEQLVAKITEMVLSKLNDEMSKSRGNNTRALTSSELLEWQANDILAKKGYSSQNAVNFNSSALTSEEIRDWQNLKLLSSHFEKFEESSGLIKFRNFC